MKAVLLFTLTVLFAVFSAAEVVSLDVYTVNDDIRMLPGTYWRANQKDEMVIVSVIIKDGSIQIFELQNGQIHISADLNLKASRLRSNSVQYGVFTPIGAAASVRMDEIVLNDDQLTFSRRWLYYDSLVGGSPATTSPNSTQASGFVAHRLSQIPLSYEQLMDFTNGTSERQIYETILARENKRLHSGNVVQLARWRQCERQLK